MVMLFLLLQEIKFGLAQGFVLVFAGFEVGIKSHGQFFGGGVIHFPEGGDYTFCTGIGEGARQADNTFPLLQFPDAGFTGGEKNQIRLQRERSPCPR